MLLLPDEKVKDGKLVKKCAKWSDFLGLASSLPLPDAIFRGQQKVLNLFPSLYREYGMYRMNRLSHESGIIEEEKEFTDLEDKLKLPAITLKEELEIFKRGMQGHCNLPFCENDMDENYNANIEWWCLGRHHCLKTPLLDWTHVPGIALFFAFADYNPIKDNSVRQISILNKRFIKDWQDSHRDKQFEYFCDGEEKRNVSISEYRLNVLELLSHSNKNMIAQQGAFTFVEIKDLKKDWRLTAVDQWMDVFLKEVNPDWDHMPLWFGFGLSWAFGTILIEEKKEDDRANCLRYLNSLNINYKTLFPGPEGAAKHANLCLEIPGYA